MRSAKYTGNWDSLLGSIDTDFVIAVTDYDTNNETTIADLLNVDTFTIPSTGEKVDFIHMFAAMEGYLTGSTPTGDLTGWGGDLCQLAGDGKPENFNATSGSSFGSADVCADFDAINIITRYKASNNKSLHYHIVEYYKNLTNKSRVQQFKDIIFPNTPNSNTEVDIESFKSAIFNRIKSSANSFTISMAFSKIFGYSFSSKESMIKKCAYEMSKYILNTINS